MLRRKQFAAVVASVAVAATSLLAAPAAQAATATLKIGSAVDVTMPFDPYAMSDGHYRPIMATAYESLLIVRPNYSGFDPGLATKWKWKGNKTLVLTLRTGVKFSDGTTFDATAVKANLDRVLVNKFAGPRTGALNNVSDVVVVNANSVQINLKQPDNQLLLWLSLNMGYMVSPKAISAADKNGNLTSLATATAGTGAYILDWSKSVKGSKYVFTRNPGYWQKGAALKKAYPWDEVVYGIYGNATARANALRSGDVDVALIGNFDMPAVDNAGFAVKTWDVDVMRLALSDRNGVYNKALSDVRVRQAISYAINRNQLAAFGNPTSQSFPKGVDAFNPKWDNYYAYNPTKAKSLLAAAGYANGFTLTLAGIADPTFSAIAQIVQNDLKAVGITVNITNEANIFAGIQNTKYNGFFFPYGAASVPSVVNDMFGPGKVRLNPLGETDEKVMALLDTYLAASTPAAFKSAGQAVGKYALENALEIPLERPTYYWCYNPKVIKGLTFTTGNVMPNLAGFLKA